MKRKLVKQGAATMMISLPSKWIKNNKLGKGDEVDMIEKENKIEISNIKREEKTRQTINISNCYPLINRILMSLYIKGIDELEVNFSNKEEIKDFQKRVINELLGFEIIKQSQKSLIIKDITGTKNQDLDELIQRIFLILDSMAQELIEALEKNQSLEPIVDIDTSINKFVNFSLRILNKQGYKEFEKTSQIYGIITSLEEIGDLYKKLASSSRIKPSKPQIALISETKEFLSLFRELFFSFNKEKTIDFAKEYELIKSKMKNKDNIDFYISGIIETTIKMNNYLLVSKL